MNVPNIVYCLLNDKVEFGVPQTPYRDFALDPKTPCNFGPPDKKVKIPALSLTGVLKQAN